MKRHNALFAVAALRTLLTLLMLSGLACVKRPVDYEREYARTLAPKRLEPSAPKSSAGPRRTLRVRVYADADYRAQVRQWERVAEAQLRRASAVVEGPLGVAFEVDSARAWPQQSAGQELPAALARLEALDPGEDVDLVIGFVSALPVFSASHHDLGLARMFGRHCVIRGMDNPGEHQSLMAIFQHLPDNEREALYRERKLHKETSVLLHEWAHTLGAFHVQDSRWMMYPGYEPTQAAFAPNTLRLLELSLRHLPQGRRNLEAQQAWARELRELLTATVWPEWEGPEKDAALQWTERALASNAPLGSDLEKPLSPADRRRLEEVLESDKQGRFEVAAQQLEPLVQRYPRHEQIQVLACYLAVRTAPQQPSTLERCEAAAEQFQSQISPLMNLALLRLQAGNPAEAQAYLVKVQQRLLSQQRSAPEDWASLASLFQKASCVTWAEQAAAKAAGTEEADRVLAWVARTRRWKVLPADPERSGVPVEQEWKLIQAVKEIEALFDREALGQVRSKLAALSKQFPRAAVLPVLQCELNLRSGQRGPARAACQQALAAHEEAVQAHFLLAFMAAGTRGSSEVRTHLERVIALDPTHKDAWRMLAEQYRAAGQADSLKDLQERYRKQFAQELR